MLVSVPSPQVGVFEKSSVIRFNVAGLPAPEVEWMYPDGARLEGRAYTQANGHLNLTETRVADAGLYTVLVKNMFGMDSAVVELVVQSK